MIGYCVPIAPKLASFRLRVLIPSRFVGPHVIGGIGDVTFFYKNGNPALARRVQGPTVYDVVNAHFDDPDYRDMCDIASVITCSSEAMRRIILGLGRDAAVIPDPYENAEYEPAMVGDRVLWFGHQANIASLKPYADIDVEICSGLAWTREQEDRDLASAAIVLLTGSNPGASANRVVKALRAGRFVVCPEDSPESWKEFSDFIWIGDVRKGIEWALDNREEACRRVKSAQSEIRKTFSPQSIGSQWADLFASTLELGTSMKRDGFVLTSR